MEEKRRNTDTQIEVLAERVENWMATTTEYRRSLCLKVNETNDKVDSLATKMDKINDRINDRLNILPCKERHENTKNIHMQLRALWVIVSAAFLGVLAEWIRLK